MRVTQTAINGWKSTLAASEDPQQQAIGLALEDAHPETPGIEQPQDTPVNNRIVLSAIETGDPVVYALALSQCGNLDYNMAAGPCQGLSWERWANIDPDNAVPWLAIAAKADSSGNQQAVEDALAKAVTASRFDSYGSTVAAIALRALPRDIAPMDKAVAGAEMTSALGMGVLPAHILLTLCSDKAVQEPTRKQQCTSLANDLAAGGTTAFDVAAASNLAKRLGLPTDRQTKLQKEAQNVARASLAHNPWRYTAGESGLTLVSDFGCDTVLGYDNYLDALQAAGGNQRAALAAVEK
jgi:hypothetical protein